MKTTTTLLALLSFMISFSCSEKDDDIVSNNPQDVSVTSHADVLSSSSATLNGYANGANGAIGFCYSSTEKSPTFDNATVVKAISVMADNSYSVTLTQLSASTIYYYRAYATKDGLAVLAKDVKTFQTEDFKMETVDLGLPSGLKWAICNLGANSPEGYGDYYAWGETNPKTYFDYANYKWWNGTNFLDIYITKYCEEIGVGCKDNKTTLDLEDDAAHVLLGGTWRMPTMAEQDELRKECVWTWTAKNGVNGYLVKGKNGNSIFFPTSGGMNGNILYDAGEDGEVWSSTLGDHDAGVDARTLFFTKGIISRGNMSRQCGLPIRPVCK